MSDTETPRVTEEQMRQFMAQEASAVTTMELDATRSSVFLSHFREIRDPSIHGWDNSKYPSIRIPTQDFQNQYHAFTSRDGEIVLVLEESSNLPHTQNPSRIFHSTDPRFLPDIEASKHWVDKTMQEQAVFDRDEAALLKHRKKLSEAEYTVFLSQVLSERYDPSEPFGNYRNRYDYRHPPATSSGWSGYSVQDEEKTRNRIFLTPRRFLAPDETHDNAVSTYGGRCVPDDTRSPVICEIVPGRGHNPAEYYVYYHNDSELDHHLAIAKSVTQGTPQTEEEFGKYIDVVLQEARSRDARRAEHLEAFLKNRDVIFQTVSLEELDIFHDQIRDRVRLDAHGVVLAQEGIVRHGETMEAPTQYDTWRGLIIPNGSLVQGGFVSAYDRLYCHEKNGLGEGAYPPGQMRVITNQEGEIAAIIFRSFDGKSQAIFHADTPDMQQVMKGAKWAARHIPRYHEGLELFESERETMTAAASLAARDNRPDPTPRAPTERPFSWHDDDEAAERESDEIGSPNGGGRPGGHDGGRSSGGGGGDDDARDREADQRRGGEDGNHAAEGGLAAAAAGLLAFVRSKPVCYGVGAVMGLDGFRRIYQGWKQKEKPNWNKIALGGAEIIGGAGVAFLLGKSNGQSPS